MYATKKEEFVRELRERQIKLGVIPEDIVNKMADDTILNSYRICSECGATLWDIEELDVALTEAKDVDEVFERLECLHQAKKHLTDG